MTIKSITIVGQPGTKVGYDRTWQLGYDLWDGFDGDSLNRSIASLDEFLFHGEDGTNFYNPLTRNDLARAACKANQEMQLWHGETYRAYARYRRDSTTGKPVFTHIEFSHADLLFGPHGPAIRLGTITL